jgi:hypothetical protein
MKYLLLALTFVLSVNAQDSIKTTTPTPEPEHAIKIPMQNFDLNDVCVDSYMKGGFHDEKCPLVVIFNALNIVYFYRFSVCLLIGHWFCIQLM